MPFSLVFAGFVVLVFPAVGVGMLVALATDFNPWAAGVSAALTTAVIADVMFRGGSDG